MESIQQVITTWKSIDGMYFSSPKACENHEATIDPVLRFLLEKKFTSAQISETAYYEIGYENRWTTEAYEAPGFLRAGGSYTEHHSSETVLEVVHGRLDKVVAYALTLPKWVRERSDRFVRKAKVTHLGDI